MYTQSTVSRRSEIDVNGIMKKANYRPKAKRYTTETLPDRELLVHAILALWRADTSWFLDNLDPAEERAWIPHALEHWQASTDYSIKFGYVRTMRLVLEGVRNSPVDSHSWIVGSKWVVNWA